MARTTPWQHNQSCITLATTRQPHTNTRRPRSRRDQCGQQRNPRQIDRVWLRQRRTDTTCWPHPGGSTTNPASNMPATARPRRQRLIITSCAHAGLCTKDPTEHTSSTRQPRTRQRQQQQEGPNDEQANHQVANTTMHQPNSCSDNDATINRIHASPPKLNQPGMQGSKRERRPTGRQHHGVPRPPTTIPTDTAEHRDSTIIQPTNLQQRSTSNPRPPGRAQAGQSQEA